MITKVGPFDLLEVGEESELVMNPFSGQTALLEPKAVAMYDVIKGFEMYQDYENVRKGLDYFSKTWPEEYMILLD